MTLSQLSAIARQGSGSACRSLFGGFVRWEAGFGSEEVYGLPSGDRRDAAVAKLEAAKSGGGGGGGGASGEGKGARGDEGTAGDGGGFMMMAAAGAVAETKAGDEVGTSDAATTAATTKTGTFSSLPSVATDCGGEDSVAVQVFPESHWEELRALVLVVSAREKDVGSTPVGFVAERGLGGASERERKKEKRKEIPVKASTHSKQNENPGHDRVCQDVAAPRPPRALRREAAAARARARDRGKGL